MKGDELLKYKSVQNWINSLDQSATQRGKDGLTKNAKAMRLGRMWEYTLEGKLNPDELLKEAQENIDNAGQRLKDYFDKKKKETSHNTAVTSVGFLRGFYTHNDVVFPKKWGTPRREVSKVAKRDEKTSFYQYDDKKDEVVFKNGNLQHFVQNLNFRDQTIALCLLSTGADATDLLNLKVGFVKDGQGKISTKKRFFWHGNRAKTGIPFKTFFSEEATQFLKRYVEQERANASDDEPLFVTNTREYIIKKEGSPRKGEKVVVDEYLTAHALSINFRDSAQKMGYAKEKNKSSPFRPKRFRHLFRTACAIAHIDEGFTMGFMGHASNVSAGYLEQDSSIFEKMYVKIEPLLTVFGVNSNQVNEITKEHNELKSDFTKYSQKTLRLEAQIEDLKEQLRQATQMIYSFEPLLNTLSEIADTPEGQKLIDEARRRWDKTEVPDEETKRKFRDEVIKRTSDTKESQE